MTQQVGLITYLKIKVKSFFKRRISPSASKDQSRVATDIEALLAERAARRPKPVPYTKYKNNNTIHVQSGGKTKINGVVYDGDVYIKNGKRLEPGTPEYIAFKKDMENFQKEMTDWSKDFGTSMEEMSKNMRNMFK